MKDNVYTLEFWRSFREIIKAKQRGLDYIRDNYTGYLIGLFKANRITSQKLAEMTQILILSIVIERKKLRKEVNK